jgi:hypothetical protein
MEEGGAALTEQIGVVQLVDRMGQVEPAQERIWGDLSGAQNVAPAIGLNLGEAEQLAHAPLEIAPDPPVNRPQHPIHARSSWHRGDTLAYPQER